MKNIRAAPGIVSMQAPWDVCFVQGFRNAIAKPARIQHLPHAHEMTNGRQIYVPLTHFLSEGSSVVLLTSLF